MRSIGPFSSEAPQDEAARGEPSRPDLRAIAAALPAGSPALALCAPPAPADRRVARFVLREAAAFGGGEAASLASGELLLGGTAAAAERAADQLREWLGLDPLPMTLPEALPELEAWLPRASRPSLSDAPGWAALESRCAALAVAECAAVSLFVAAPGGPVVAQRLSPRLPPLAEPEARALARDRLCRRLLQALASPAGFTQLPPLRPGLRLLLDLPSTGLAGGGLMGHLPGPPPIALLPLALLANPAGFAALRGRLEGAGWEVALLADAPAALEWPIPQGCWLAAPVPARAPAAPPPPRLIALGASPAWVLQPDALAPGCLLERPA